METKEVSLPDLLNAFPEEFHELSPVQQKLSLQLYRTLAEGRPVPPAHIAATLALTEPAVSAILKGWPGVYYDEARRVIGYWGLALPEMTHRFEVQGRLLYTWCAWDSLFIPELIQQVATVTSSCPVTREAIRLTVTPEGIRDCSPADTVMSFLTPPAASFRKDVIQHFCHYVHFFSSADAGAQWLTKHQGTFLLSLDQAAKLARIKNRVQYPTLTCADVECRA